MTGRRVRRGAAPRTTITRGGDRVSAVEPDDGDQPATTPPASPRRDRRGAKRDEVPAHDHHESWLLDQRPPHWD